MTIWVVIFVVFFVVMAAASLRRGGRRCGCHGGQWPPDDITVR